MNLAKLNSWPPSEQPRERLLAHGASYLSDAELLSLVLGASSRGSGGVLATSRALLSRFGGIEGVARRRPRELLKVPGIGVARACALVAVAEVARRLESERTTRGAALCCSDDVYRYVKPQLTMQEQEVFVSLALDARHRVIAINRVARGTATSVEVHPREVFGAMVRDGAAAVIVAHNHPSGDPEPSLEDRQLTQRLRQAGEIIGIPLLDHLIVGARRYVSLADRGQL